jgi:LysR family transcriptional regulator (chromosome initiation inhibitor)
MLDYALLEAAAAVIREGGFERAGRVLHLSTSAVSQRVKLLEERVGAPVVVRGRPCVATALGQRLCRHWERVGLLEQELGDVVPAAGAEGVASAAAVLRLAVNADSLGTWFPSAMARFTEGEATLLHLSVDNEDHTSEWLRSGQVLAAVTSEASAAPGCRSLLLGRMRYLATASPAFLRRCFEAGVTAATLARAPMIRFDRKDELEHRWMRKVCRRDVSPPTHYVPTTQAFLDVTLAGIAWGMIPAGLAAPDLAQGRLVELLPASPLEVPLYWHHVRLAPPAVERLTRAVVQAARAWLDAPSDAAAARRRGGR